MNALDELCISHTQFAFDMYGIRYSEFHAELDLIGKTFDNILDPNADLTTSDIPSIFVIPQVSLRV